MTGLTNDTSYRFEVRAVNTAGGGAAGALPRNVTPRAIACAAPATGERRIIWTGVMTVGQDSGGADGYDRDDAAGMLTPDTFSLGGDAYTISALYMVNGDYAVALTLESAGVGVAFADAQRAALILHDCDDDLALSDATVASMPIEYLINVFDESVELIGESTVRYPSPWILTATRTLRLSLPANRPATGLTITGTADVGETLLADTSAVMDPDGIPDDVEYAWQWLRVDADGESNEEVIPTATSSTYTLTADDLGKKVKARITFTDTLYVASYTVGMDTVSNAPREMLTSEAFPAIHSVRAPFAIEDTTVHSTPQGLLSLDATTPDIYGEEESIEIAVHFNRPVTVTGAPTFVFDLGGAPRTATLARGSGTETLVFAYTVVPADTDPDGIAWAGDAFTQGTATLVETDAAATPIVTHAAKGPFAAHKVDGSQRAAPRPVVSWASDAYDVDEGASVDVTVTLRTVEGEPRPDAALTLAVRTAADSASPGDDFTALDATHTVAPEAWTPAGTAFTASVTQSVETAEDAAFEGAERFHVLVSTPAGAEPIELACPAALRNLDGAASCATEVTIADDDTLSVTGVTVTSTPATPDTYLATETIRLTATFTAAVTVDTTDGTPALAFTLGDTPRSALYASGSGSASLVFAYTVAAGDLDRDGLSWEANALAPEGGTIRFTTDDPSLAVDADLAHARGESQTAHKVDAKAPVLASAAYLGAEVELIYDEPLDAASTPAKTAYTLEVQVGGTAVTPAITIDAVRVSAARVLLALSAEPPEDAAVTLAYTVPSAMPIQDAVGNDAPAFAAMTLEPGEQLRLIGNDGQEHAFEGRLEVRYHGEWGTVCDHYWTDIESDLVCRLLGHPRGSTGNGGRFLGAHFGEGTGKIWLDNVVCTGAEKRLSDCARRRSAPGKATPELGESNCSHAQDVGVQCKVSDTASAPQVTGAPGLSDAPGGDGMWGPSERLEVTVTFTEAVEVDTAGGTPSLEVGLGTTKRRAAYTSGTGTATLVFGVTLGADDGTHTTVSVTENTLATGGGHIRGATTGLAARLAHAGATRAGTDTAPGALTARFERVPSMHRGVGSAFSVEVRFSAEPAGLSFESMAGAVFEVTGGAVTGARRLESGKSRRWEVEVTPSVDGAVTVTTRATTDCEAAHAVCTTGGDKLAGGASATVPGLPVFSVADATVEEAAGAALDFEVTLDRAASVRVAVRYKTVNGTATAGPAHETYEGGAGGWTGARNDCWGRPKGRTYAGDYVPVSGLLIFDAGTTARTVSVPVCVDAHDETSETMRLELTEAVIAEGIWVSSRFEEGEAGVGTITNDGAMPREWLSRFGRTVGTQVLDALGGRFDGAGGAGGSHVTVGGIPLTGAGQVPEEEETERTDPFALPEWATRAREAEARTPTMEELILGSAFTLRAGAEDDEGPAYTAWGRVARGGFSAEVEEPGRERLALDGEVTTGFVGLDAEWERLIAGVLLSRSRGEGTYRLTTGMGTGTGSGSGDGGMRIPAKPITASGGGDGAGTRQSTAGTGTGGDGNGGEGTPRSTAGTDSGGNGGEGTPWSATGTASGGGGDGVGTRQSTAGTGIGTGGDGDGGEGTPRSATGTDSGGGDDGGEGTVDSTLTGVYPYARLALGPRVSVWAVVGVGTGELALRPPGSEVLETGMSLTLGGLGIAGQVLDGTGAGGVSLDVRSDALWVRTRSDAITDARAGSLASAEGDVTRLRLLLRTERAFAFEGGATFTPSGEVGLRHDGGDAETGTGVELGLGLRYGAGALTAQGRFRALVAHEADGYEEWGASASVRYGAGASGRGLTLELAPEWGRTGSAAERMGSARAAGDLVAGDGFEAPGRLRADLGYGFGFGGGLTGGLGLGARDSVLTPYTGLALGDGGSRQWRFGVRWQLGAHATAGLEATRDAGADGAESADALALRVAVRF